MAKDITKESINHASIAGVNSGASYKSHLTNPTSYHLQRLGAKVIPPISTIAVTNDSNSHVFNNSPAEWADSPVPLNYDNRQNQIRLEDQTTANLINNGTSNENSYYHNNAKAASSINDHNEYIELSKNLSCDELDEILNLECEYGGFDAYIPEYQTSMSCPNDIYYPGQQKSHRSLTRYQSNGYQDEKDKIRKSNHNRVERARRDNINDRIKELATLLPKSMELKHNKGTILRATVTYMRECQCMNQKIRKLEEKQACLEQLCLNLIDKVQALEKNQQQQLQQNKYSVY